MIYNISQGGLYSGVLNIVDDFRVYIGAPDNERFNLVLFGGLFTHSDIDRSTHIDDQFCTHTYT